mmetsp:Transcript_61883/g.139263  ORF Transcript_61883/g.139263 Transcript_61883/m.139263 type:complete len:132 (-) Transcript_61883:295-690(-)
MVAGIPYGMTPCTRVVCVLLAWLFSLLAPVSGVRDEVITGDVAEDFTTPLPKLSESPVSLGSVLTEDFTTPQPKISGSPAAHGNDAVDGHFPRSQLGAQGDERQAHEQDGHPSAGQVQRPSRDHSRPAGHQ